MIRRAVAGHSLAADIELVLKSTPDSMQGKTTHRICFRRYVEVRGADPKSGGMTLQSILDGKVRFFTNRLVDTKQAGWNRGSEWRGHGIGSRVAMQNRLANAVNNGAPWMNIRSAMAAQVRDYAQATGALQDSLIRAFDVVSHFADRFYVDGGAQGWPVTFLLELLFFQLDTVIAGPSTNASNDAKRNLEAAVPSGDIVSSSRHYEELQLAVKDPEGKKKMTMEHFYNDQTCVEELHEGFIALYSGSPEHNGIMVDMHAELAQRRLDRFLARMRVAWNVAYHSTRSQQDSDRQERDRKADTSPSYEPNDRVLLRVPLDKKTHKLSSQWEGPYRIASPDGVLPNGNYRLTDLKDRRRREEVSGDRLRLYLTVTDADRIQPDEFLVDQILKSRGTGRTREYLVKWRGYPVREATWEPRAPLMVRCSDMIRAFDERQSPPEPAVVTTTFPLPVANSPPLPVGPAMAPTAPSLPVPAPAPAASLPVSTSAVSAPPAPTVPAGSVSSKHYRDSDYRLHSSKVAFFDPLTGEVYSHVRRAGGLDLPGGHRDQGETSAAEALLRECLTEELRVPASLASRLRKYAKRAPYVQVVPRRTAVHVVSLWLVPATPAELAGIEQTDDGKREAHSPELRPFATFQAESPYAEAFATGLRGLHFRRDLRQFGATETLAAHVAADQASASQPPDSDPTPPSPDAAKYERGHWFYRQTFPSRKGSNTRWFPSTRYSKSELEEMAPLRVLWNANLHQQDIPLAAVAAVVAAAMSPTPPPIEETLRAHFLRCANSGTSAPYPHAGTFPRVPVSKAC